MEERNEKVTLKIDKKKKFKPIFSTTVVNYNELGELINELIAPMFKDYAGAQPVVENGVVSAMLEFIPGTDNGFGGIEATIKIEDDAKTETNSTVAAYIISQNIKKSYNGDSFKLTEAAQDLLSKYINFPANQIQWNMYTSQHVQPSNGYTTNRVLYYVTRLDIGIMLHDIYDNENNDKLTYLVKLSDKRDINSGVGMNYLFELTRLVNDEAISIERKHFAPPMLNQVDWIVPVQARK